MRGALVFAARWPRAYLAGALATFSAAAAAIHLSVVGEHVHESLLFGTFFACAGLGQAAWAVAVTRAPDGKVLLAGAVGNAAIMAIWAMSRTVGIPVGPHRWMAEAVSAPDAMATAFEALIVVGTWALARRPDPPSASVSPYPRFGTGGLRRLLGGGLLLLALGFVLSVAGASGTEGHGSGSPAAAGLPEVLILAGVVTSLAAVVGRSIKREDGAPRPQTERRSS